MAEKPNPLKRPRQSSSCDEDLLREEFANKFSIGPTVEMDCHLEQAIQNKRRLIKRKPFVPRAYEEVTNKLLFPSEMSHRPPLNPESHFDPKPIAFIPTDTIVRQSMTDVMSIAHDFEKIQLAANVIADAKLSVQN
jgi:hypothetical protein